MIKVTSKIKIPGRKVICLFLLIIFIIDSSFHLTRMVMNGSSALRLLLLATMLLISIFGIFKNGRIKLNRVDCSMLFFTMLLLTAYIKSLILDGDMQYAQTYIKYGFVYLLLLPILYYCLDSMEKCKILIKWSSISGLITSLLSTTLTVSIHIKPALYTTISSSLINMEMVSIIAPLGGGVRVMLSGMLLQVLGVFGGIYFFVLGEKKYIWGTVAVINLFGILLTYARGLIAGTLLGLLIWMFLSSDYKLKKRKRLKLLKSFCVVGAILVLTYVIFWNNNDILKFIIERFLGKSSDGTAESDLFRKNMEKMINDKIWEAPLFGSGLGAHISLRDGAIEMTFQDIVIRMGLIGLILFLYPYFHMLMSLINKKTNGWIIRGVLFSALTATMFAAYFNPYLITSLGLFLYCFCIRVISIQEDRDIKHCLASPKEPN